MERGGTEGHLKIFAIHTGFMNSKLDLLSPDGPENLPLFDRSGLLKAVLAQFRISRHGCMAPATGADLHVV